MSFLLKEHYSAEIALSTETMAPAIHRTQQASYSNTIRKGKVLLYITYLIIRKSVYWNLEL